MAAQTQAETYRSKPLAAASSKLNCQKHDPAQYCACGTGLLLSALTKPEMHPSSFHTAVRNCFLLSTAPRTWAATSHNGCRPPLRRVERDLRNGWRRFSGNGWGSVLWISHVTWMWISRYVVHV